MTTLPAWPPAPPLATAVVNAGPFDATTALAALANYPLGTVLYEATDAADPTTIYAEWVKAGV